MAEDARAGREKMEAEFAMRLADARMQKAHFERDMREAYYFMAPHRARSVNSNSPPSSSKPKDAGSLQTSFGFEMGADFSTVIMNTFLPEAETWCQRKAGYMVKDQTQKDDLDKQAADGDRTIFDAITASNFYSECGKGFTPDLAIGTVAMWVDKPRPGEPQKCQSIPIRELEINLGPYGDVDDRFVVRHTSFRHIKTLLPGVEMPAKVKTAMDRDPKKKCAVVWGFWRDWSDMGQVCWHRAVTVDGVLVDDGKLDGAGSCPLIVGRFNPSTEWAWATGPGIQFLPDIRNLDELTGMKTESLGMSIKPPISIPDDSSVNFEQGIEEGMAYPIRPGSEGAIKNLYTPNPPDSAIYEVSQLQTSIKRLFYLDWPQQRGDTPPTATQWLDQMTMAQRRIGTPGLSFWREFPAEIFMRFQWMLEKAGTIKPAVIDGKAVALVPYNPAQRAAEQQDVASASRAIEIGAQAFPEEWKVAVDGTKTIQNFVKTLGAQKIIAFRDPDHVAAAVDQIKQLAGGTPGNAQPVGAPPDATQSMAGQDTAPPQVQLRGRGL